MQFMPEGESARDDKSDEKANQEEPAVRGERDEENRYYCDGDDETRRSPQAESRAAAGFRLHEFYFTAGSQTPQMSGEGILFGGETCLGRASEFAWLLLHFGCLLYGYYLIHNFMSPPIRAKLF
jgi:hypothetical protein